MLPDDALAAQRLLLGGNVNIEIGIEVIKRTYFDVSSVPSVQASAYSHENDADGCA